MIHTIKRTVIAFIVATTMVGCGNRSKNEDTTPEKERAADKDAVIATGAAAGPEWVRADCASYFKAKGQKALCGVGVVKGVADPGMARTAALSRGRTEIARTIQVEIKSVLTDYQKQGADSNGVLQGEQAIESISRQVSDVTLNGSRMTDSWVAPDGTFYALMVLEQGDFTTAISDSPQMDAPIREVVLAVAPKLFSAYDDETSAY
ncbi:MAG: LPP20 family lipoprotein [Deltaproteobacteria bacterium]|nr:LPP20 family lipoprotein [Deltaproteobacteria bacterium]